MLTATARAGEGKGGGEEGAALTLGQLELLQALLPRVELPVPLLRELVELRHALMARGVPVSDRRFARALGPMRAQALLAGRERCGVEELPLLCHILWNEPEERVEISEALERITGGRQAERH